MHQSKEYLIVNGLYTKPVNQKNINKWTKGSKLLTNDNNLGNNELNEKNKNQEL